jgi:hypothetical protein
VCSGAEDANAAIGVFDDGEDVHARAVKGGGGEKVAGQDRVGLGLFTGVLAGRTLRR